MKYGSSPTNLVRDKTSAVRTTLSSYSSSNALLHIKVECSQHRKHTMWLRFSYVAVVIVLQRFYCHSHWHSSVGSRCLYPGAAIFAIITFCTG
jgi:hypothetical protein